MMDHRTVMGFRRDEALKQRKIDRAVMRRVFHYIRPYRGQLIAFIIAVILASVATALSPLLLKGLLHGRALRVNGVYRGLCFGRRLGPCRVYRRVRGLDQPVEDD